MADTADSMDWTALYQMTQQVRVRIDLSNGDVLEAAEFFGRTPDGVQVLDYRHQWMNGPL